MTQITDEMVEAAREALRVNGAARYQGFFYRPWHVIRDLSKPWDDQQIWAKEGEGDEYEDARDDMIRALDGFRIRDALAAVAPLIAAQVRDEPAKA